eukprot:g2634.t1
MRPLGPRRMKKKKKKRWLDPEPSTHDGGDSGEHSGKATSITKVDQDIEIAQLTKQPSSASSTTAISTPNRVNTMSPSSLPPQQLLHPKHEEMCIAPSKPLQQPISTSPLRKPPENKTHPTSVAATQTFVPHSPKDYMRVYVFAAPSHASHQGLPQSHMSRTIGVCLALASQADRVAAMWADGNAPSSDYTTEDNSASGCEVTVRLLGEVFEGSYEDSRDSTVTDLNAAEYFAERFERPSGKYALIIASGGTVTNTGDNETSRITDARLLEKSLRGLGYAITRVTGDDASKVNVLTALENMVRPSEPPGRGMGRGGWWAGGASATSTVVYISLDAASSTTAAKMVNAGVMLQAQASSNGLSCADGNIVTFEDIRKSLLAGARAHRPFYLQGYRHPTHTNGVSSKRARITTQSARVLCIIDGQLDVDERSKLRGHETVVQSGLRTVESLCEQPMDCAEIASVQMLVMPFIPECHDIETMFQPKGEAHSNQP